MTVSVDIADRLYDYTDEEVAQAVVALFQEENGLSDDDIVSLWNSLNDPLRVQLENRIFKAVDSNGTAKRADNSIPGGIELFVEDK
jgi:hypothetical protein